MVGLISGNDETHYREEVQHLTQWCSDNNVVFNTRKTREVIVDHRRSKKREHISLLIHGEVVGVCGQHQVPGHPHHFQPDLSLNNCKMSWTLLSVVGKL